MKILFASLFFVSALFGHSALLNCFDNADGTFTCEGGFSDGSSAQGINIIIKDNRGNVLQKATLDSNSEVVLTKPEGDFSVLFDGGPGHSVEILGSNI